MISHLNFNCAQVFVHHPGEDLIFSVTNSLQNIVFTDYYSVPQEPGGGGGPLLGEWLL